MATGDPVKGPSGTPTPARTPTSAYYGGDSQAEQESNVRAFVAIGSFVVLTVVTCVLMVLAYLRPEQFGQLMGTSVTTLFTLGGTAIGFFFGKQSQKP